MWGGGGGARGSYLAHGLYVCQLRGLSALSGEQFPPTLCGRLGEAAPLLFE